jgi:single-strand DNA-binding protein
MFQQTQIIGNLGGDPELRYTPSGQAVCNFSVATSRKWTDSNTGEVNEKTTWFRVTAWGKLGEVCNTYLTKGRQVFVSGEVEAQAWSDREGNPRATLALTAREIKFLGGKRENGNGGGYEAAEESSVTEDEIPF